MRALNNALDRHFGLRIVRTSKHRVRQWRGSQKRAAKITQVTPRAIKGWVAVTDENEAVAVTLRINGHPVFETIADVNKSHIHGENIREFYIGLRGIWDYCKKTDRLTVMVDDRAIPFKGRRKHINPANDGFKNLEELLGLLSHNHTLTREGEVQMKKTIDTSWRGFIFELHDQISEVFRNRYGIELFLIYGNLLGFVREGGFIGHDDDLDLAFISPHKNARSATGQLVEIAEDLARMGEFEIDLRAEAIHIHSKVHPQFKIDVFHLFFDEDGQLQFPYGVAGQIDFEEGDWAGTEEQPFNGHLVRVPVNSELLVEHIYGPNWRIPVRGFKWAQARTRIAADANTFKSERQRINSIGDTSPAEG